MNTRTSPPAPLATADHAAARVRHAVEAEAQAYANGADRPLEGYALLLTVYATAVASLAGLVRRRGTRLPDRPSAADLALIAVATHKISRMMAKDAVLAAVRAPFTRFTGRAGPGEVNEEVRADGAAHAVGELVTCPFCLAQWVATGFVFGLLLAPRATRLVASTFCAVAASDVLQFAYTALEQSA